jgi:hypothetical protein
MLPNFYSHYWNLLSECKKNLNNMNRPTKSWARRIGNALYFFNQTYFVELADSAVSDGYRRGNIDRLITNITALDALFCKNSGSEELSKHCFEAIGQTFPKIKERIEYFYEVRSNYIHANETSLVNRIADTEISELHLYLQKAILFNLELLGNHVFKEQFVKSGQNNYFDFIAKSSGSSGLKTANVAIQNSQDLYRITKKL